MTLCQHGVQTGTGYECSACVTTGAGNPRALPAEILAEFESIEEALDMWAMPHDVEASIRRSLGRIEQYLRSGGTTS